MSRATVKKILGKPRPLDKFNFLKSLPTEYTYCERTKRCRNVKTGGFVVNPSKERMPWPHHTERQSRKIGEPPIVKTRTELRVSSGTTGSSVLKKLDNFKRLPGHLRIDGQNRKKEARSHV